MSEKAKCSFLENGYCIKLKKMCPYDAPLLPTGDCWLEWLRDDLHPIFKEE